MKQFKKITTVQTADELCSKHFDGLHNDDITYEKIQKYAIEFAKLHVEEALKITSKKFKNPDNIRAILKTYSLDNVE